MKDTRCPRCEYDLRGQSANLIRCPECGLTCSRADAEETYSQQTKRSPLCYLAAVFFGIACGCTGLELSVAPTSTICALLLSFHLGAICPYHPWRWGGLLAIAATAPWLLVIARNPFDKLSLVAIGLLAIFAGLAIGAAMIGGVVGRRINCLRPEDRP
ncbi:MAG: hypothetical protein KDA32_01905 [Phycisphaerales bacterium]|nr:hypothetical protein [Phycisphaerales bacterium]